MSRISTYWLWSKICREIDVEQGNPVSSKSVDVRDFCFLTTFDHFTANQRYQSYIRLTFCTSVLALRSEPRVHIGSRPEHGKALASSPALKPKSFRPWKNPCGVGI